MPAPDEDVFTTWTIQTENDGISVVTLCGELDASTVPRFLSEIQQMIDKGSHIIFDVHILSYIDNTGVAAILSVKNALQLRNKELCLVGCHGLLEKILHNMQLEKNVNCYEDLDSAIESIRTDI